MHVLSICNILLLCLQLAAEQTLRCYETLWMIFIRFPSSFHTSSFSIILQKLSGDTLIHVYRILGANLVRIYSRFLYAFYREEQPRLFKIEGFSWFQPPTGLVTREEVLSTTIFSSWGEGNQQCTLESIMCVTCFPTRKEFNKPVWMNGMWMRH